MTQREVMVRVKKEIDEALPKATGETAKILSESSRDLAAVLSKGLLSSELREKVFRTILKRLGEVPTTDAMNHTATRWVLDLLESGLPEISKKFSG